jgi:hypothetical protein
MMRAFGYEKELVVGEYNAPWPNLYPEATVAMEQAMAAVFAVGAATGGDPNSRNAVGSAAIPQQSPEEIAMQGFMDLLFGKLALLDLEGTDRSRIR